VPDIPDDVDAPDAPVVVVKPSAPPRVPTLQDLLLTDQHAHQAQTARQTETPGGVESEK
jgi:hypothetical protein